MKKTLIYILFIFLTDILFASTKEITAKQYKNYHNAFLAYEKKDYKNSFEIFQKLINDNVTNEKLYYAYGVSAYHLKKYTISFNVFDALIQNNPQDTKSRLQFAKTLYMIQAYKISKKQFLYLQNTPISQEEKLEIELFLKKLKVKLRNYLETTYFNIESQYDTNINRTRYKNHLITNTLLKKSDTSLDVSILKTIETRNKNNYNITTLTNIQFNIHEYHKHHTNDIATFAFNSGVSYQAKKYQNTSSFLFDQLWFGGNKLFYLYGLSNKTSLLSENNDLTLDLEYTKKQFNKNQQSNKNSNIKKIELGYSIPSNQSTLKFNINYSMYRKESGTLNNINMNQSTYKLTYRKNLLNTYNFIFDYTLQQEYYKEFLYPKRRKDSFRNVSLSVLKKIDEKNSITLKIQTSTVHSSIDIYSYNRDKINLSYLYIF